MFIKISKHVRVYLHKTEQAFLEKYKNKKTFLNSQLEIDEVQIAKKLSAESILVRKKLDSDTQFAVNRYIKEYRYVDKKQV